MSGRRDFLSMPAPENYVAGLGRGATGFTTRSDLGPAREGPSEEQMKAALAERAKQLGQAAPSAYGAVEKKEEEDDEAERFQDPDNEVGLFSSGMNYDKDDDEADRIYQEVDEKMERRRKIRREAREAKEREEHERNNPKIQLLFAADKRALGSVSEEEWAALPEVGDMTGKAKRAREARMNQRSYAVPDSVISAAAQQGQLETSISSETGDGTMTNFASIGAAQKSALEVRLNSAAVSSGTQSNVSGTSTSVDPRGYITALDKSQANGEVPVEDINRARVLLESAVKTNIHNGPGYVALARLEEISNRTSAAKRTLAVGMDNCPKSIAVFEEAIRLEKKDNIHNAKIVAARGLKQNPRAIKLWMAAVDLETTTAARKKVLRQGLDHNSSSVELWKALINETEELENVRMLFAKATETVPLSEELWLSYAKISEPQNAQQILNAARKHIPSSSSVWVAACILQEQLGKEEMCDRVMERAVKALVKENAMPKREDWISIAENCEVDGAIVTASSIVKATIGWGLDEDDERRDVWLEDAAKAKAVGKPETARAILSHAVSVFTMSTTVWHALADLEKHRGNQEGLLNVLERSVNACPNSESLWLLYAREMWQAGRPADARNVIARSFRQLPGNENLYTRAVDFEIEANEFEQARRFLEIARSSSPTDRVYIKSISLERYLGELDTALDLVNTALQTWPSSWKLWAMKGQIYESMSKLKEAQEAYSMGTRACPKAPVLFILLSRIQEKQGAIVKARSSLERGRAQNQKNPEILVEAVRLERRANNASAAQKLMAEALQQCPESGLLWAEKIMHLESRTQRKPRALEAIKKVENDPILFVVVARIFWGERRLEKAQSWFTRAIVTDSDYGDGWVWYWKFLEMHGTEEKKAEVLSKCILAEPHHGEIWQSVAKDPKWVRKGVEEILKEAAKRAE